MNEMTIKALGASACIVAVYITYSITNPGGDGPVFGAVVGLLAGLAGFSAGNWYGKASK